MRVLLANPPARYPQHESIVVPPLGLLYLATVLKAAGFDVRVKDALAEGMGWDEFGAHVAAERPDVFGIGGMSPTIDTSFKAIGLARPHVKHVVMGGPHASLFRQNVFKQCPEVDSVVVGEGESTALDLLTAIRDSRPFSGIPGVVTKDQPGGDRPLLKDMDSIPFPDRSLTPHALYRYPLSYHRPVTTVFTSRGCPYACAFCDKSVFGSHWRARSADHVLGELDEIVHKYGIRSVIFYDDLFTVDSRRVTAICEGILRRGYPLDWKCEGRVNLADLELMKLMKRAGCSMIAYGVESGNQKGLDYLRKRTTPDQALKAFELTHRAGIRSMAYFILGIPTETYADAIRTINFAKQLRATYAQFSVLSPFYGTPVYEEAVSKGWYREIQAQNPMDKDLKRPVVVSDNWSEDRLRSIVALAHRQFFFRPSYMVRYALNMRSIHQWVESFRMLRHVLGWLARPKTKEPSGTTDRAGNAKRDQR